MSTKNRVVIKLIRPSKAVNSQPNYIKLKIGTFDQTLTFFFHLDTQSLDFVMENEIEFSKGVNFETIDSGKNKSTKYLVILTIHVFFDDNRNVIEKHWSI